MVESILDTGQNVMVILEKQSNVRKSLIAIVNMLAFLTLIVTMSKFPDILKYLTKNATMLRFPIVTKFHRKNATPLLTNQERGMEAAVKVWTQTKILSRNIRYFVPNQNLSRFTHFFGDLWAKKVSFWVKNSVSWARSALLQGIYCIFH